MFWFAFLLTFAPFFVDKMHTFFITESLYSYFVWIKDDIYCRVGSAINDDAMRARIDNMPADIVVNSINQAKEVLSDMPAYEAQQAKAIAEKREIKRLSDIELENKRIALEKALREKALEEERLGVIKFMAGDMIPYPVFERLCNANAIVMPIQTLGAARKHVTEVGNGKMRVNKGSSPQGVHRAASALFEVLKAI